MATIPSAVLVFARTVAAAFPLLIATAPARAQTVTVSAARAVDMDSGKLLPNPLIRIDKGVIAEVTTRKPGQPVDHDLGDVTLLPGLADAHVHLTGGEEQTPDEKRRETAARAALEGAANARKVLESGFTTVRDLSSRDLADVALRDLIARGRIAGPRMMVAVRAISATGGHMDDNALPPDIEVHRLNAVADGPQEVRAKVRELIKYGADWIKLMATGGVTSHASDPRQCDYTEEELRAAVEAAREKGREVAVHAHGTLGILRAARAGARSIEHASMLDDAAIAAVKKSGSFLVMNPVTNVIMIERGRAGGYTPDQLRKADEVYGLKMASLKKAVKARLPLAYGTDSGVQAHGTNARQLGIYVDAGMTPLEALRAATIVNARLFRMEGKIGRLARGHYGDVVAVKGDPLANVRVLERPVFVMKDGVVVLDKVNGARPTAAASSPSASAAETAIAAKVCPRCRRIFDGKTWQGWVHDPKNWTLTDGAMRGSGSGARSAFTSEDYGNFRLIVTSRMAPVNNDHLGVLFWGPRPAAGQTAYNKNLQVQPPHGAMWDYFENKELRREMVAPGTRDFESWNTMEILASIKTGSLRVAVDGREISRYKDKDPRRLVPGPIGMQRHGRGGSEYRDIFVESEPTDDRLLTVEPPGPKALSAH